MLLLKDGNTSLGFMGGQAVPAVMNFGYGYVQGANDAKELGITVKMKYHYTGGFSATPEIQTKASSWYKRWSHYCVWMRWFCRKLCYGCC